MPRVGRRLLIVAVLAVVGALAVAGVVSAKSTVKLSASKTKLAFNVTTIRAKQRLGHARDVQPLGLAARHRRQGRTA